MGTEPEDRDALASRALARTRLVRLEAHRDTGNPSPEEIILRATVEGTDRAELVRRLSEMTYTFKAYAPAPFDGSVAGTWDQVRAAVVTGFLSREEYEQVRAAVSPPE